MMKNEKNKLLVLFIAALIIRVIFVYVSPVKYWDETIYANLGYDLSNNPFDYSFENNGWSDFVPGDWPKAGYRAPLLPYSLSVFYFMNLGFLLEFFIPFIGALSVIFVYILAKEMFNEKIALYSSIFLLLLPLHVLYSGKILTDVFSTFFLILTVIFFWYGFEKGKDNYKLLFGMFFALSLLARYTVLWMIPVFFIYLLIKNRNLYFLKDEYLWLSIIVFFLFLSPWLVYGIFQYDNPFGAFIHGIKAASYWGGIQDWYFYLQYSFNMFSIVIITFLISLFFIIFNKKKIKPQLLFLLLWFFIFLFFTLIMAHKEDRFLVPLTPPLVIISSLFLNNVKKNKTLIQFSITLFLIVSLVYSFTHYYQNSYNEINKCFIEANKFLKDILDDTLIITDQSPIIYYYSKQETHFYPSPFSINNLKNLVNNYYQDREIYILFSEYDMSLESEKYKKFKEILDSNFEIVFTCLKNGKYSLVYKYS